MPPHYPEPILSNFLTNHTTPLLLSSLPPDYTECPICHEPYHGQDPYYVHPIISPDDPEYPVQIRDRGLCEHIFGRHCIEKHIRAVEPWSHVCPLCRTAWIPPLRPTRTSAIERLEAALAGLARVGREDEELREEIEGVERGLREVRRMLDTPRWL